MEVILTREVRSLGVAGQRISVKDGYARNFLIPRNLAVPASRGADSAAQSRANAQMHTAELARRKAAELGHRLEEAVCRFPMSVGEQGKLHGSVTGSDIIEELRKQGIALEKHQVHLERSLAQLGETAVPVRLHPEVKAAVRVILVKG